jgi:hypothetical protein
METLLKKGYCWRQYHGSHDTTSGLDAEGQGSNVEEEEGDLVTEDGGHDGKAQWE